MFTVGFCMRFCCFHTLHELIVVMLLIQFGAHILIVSIPGDAIGKRGETVPRCFCFVLFDFSQELSYRRVSVILPCKGCRCQAFRGAVIMLALGRQRCGFLGCSAPWRREGRRGWLFTACLSLAPFPLHPSAAPRGPSDKTDVQSLELGGVLGTVCPHPCFHVDARVSP